MHTYLVNYQSVNRSNYTKLVSAKNEGEARKVANKIIHKEDDRDTVLKVTERDDLNAYE